MRMISNVCCFLLLMMPLVAAAADPKPVAPAELPALKTRHPVPESLAGLPLRFTADFEDGRADRFTPTDPKAWNVVQQGDNHVYALIKRKSDYTPPHRSPYNIALIKDLEAGSLVIDVRLQSAMTDYAHRSLCLFFNYEDPAHFYYVHFGKRADPHANQIFIVNDAARKKISQTTTKGTPWDDNWHHARIVRDVKSGKIAVYFDDMKSPVMTATDTTFTTGQVGIGSFDDAGNFDDVRVYAKSPPTR